MYLTKIQLIFNSILLLTISPLAIAQDKDVKDKDIPEVVKNYINTTYPGAENIKYYKEVENDTMFYEVDLKFQTKDYDLMLYPDGRIYETEIEMKFNQLPEKIKEKVVTDLKVRFVKYSFRIVELVSSKDKFFYEIELKGKKAHHKGYYEIRYDKEGNFLNEKEEVIESIPTNSGY